MKSIQLLSVQMLHIACIILLQTVHAYLLKANYGTVAVQSIRHEVSRLNYYNYNSFPLHRSFITAIFSSSSTSTTSDLILQQCQQALLDFGQSIITTASSTVASRSVEKSYTANSLSEKREFITVQNGNNIERADSRAVLRILQFNVLADCLSESGHDSGDFSRADSEVLTWDYRKDRLLKELVQYQPDIITLQEVDHYHDFFLPKLRCLGYIGFFAPKPTSKCLECGKPADGCAMFINGKRLRVLCSETKTLASRKSDLSPKTSGLDGMQEEEFKIYTQNQVALIVACELIDEHREVIQSESLLAADMSNANNNQRPAPPIIICTAHLKSAKTETGEVFRLEGITNALNSVQKLFETFTAQGNMPAVILSGDFNAIPGKTSQRQPDGNIKQYEPWAYQFVKQHPLDFRSVYNDDVSDRLSCGRPLFTTWKARQRENKEFIVKRCIDYIFYAPFMQRTLDQSKSQLPNFVNFEETITSSSTTSSSRIDNDELFRTPTLVMNKNQIALSFIGRMFIYVTLLGVCTSAATSTEATLEVWRGAIIAGSVIGWWVFEASIEGTFFKPVISSKVPRPLVPPVDAPVISTNTATSNLKKEKKAIINEAPITTFKAFSVEVASVAERTEQDEENWMSQLSSTYNKILKELRYVESSVFRSLSEFSQRVSPLRQFGRPGFRCLAALDIFSEEAMEPDLIPSKEYPSDHVAIAADLELLW